MATLRSILEEDGIIVCPHIAIMQRHVDHYIASFVHFYYYPWFRFIMDTLYYLFGLIDPLHLFKTLQ